MTETNVSWRNFTEVHSVTDLLPMMTEPEIDELARDIGAHGLQQPIVLAPGEGRHVLLDGRNRLAAIFRIRDQQRRETLLREIRMGQHVVTVSANVDPCLYILGANIYRRHLNVHQRHEVISALLKLDASRSDRAIAKVTRASPSTVANVRQELERDGVVSNLDTRIGADGVSQPASKPRGGRKARLVPDKRVNARAAGGSANTQKKLSRDQLIVGFASLLHRNLVDTLLEPQKLLADEHAEMAKLPGPKRIAIARNFCETLGVTSEELHRSSIEFDAVA